MAEPAAMPEEQLPQTRRMEALGRLTAGVAHDFNNLLTGILGYASLLKTYLPEGSDGYEAADAIERSARRASELTRHLLASAHRDAPPLRPVGIQAVVEEALRILSHSVGRSVELRADLRAPSERILGDPTSLVQTVVNLGVNAAEAMPEGGVLTVSLSPCASDGSVRFDNVPVPEGRYASVSVSDTGCGIPEEIREQLFALFFTTKSPGEGAGLGLPLARMCIRAHRGFLRLESQAGKGTTVEFLIPVLEAPEPPAAPDLP